MILKKHVRVHRIRLSIRFEFPEHINIENQKKSNIKKTDKEKKNNKAINEV